MKRLRFVVVILLLGSLTIQADPLKVWQWTAPTQYENGQNVCIGSRPDNSNWFNGKIDDVRIYTSALTDAEVAALAAKPPVFQPPILENGNLILNWTGQGQLQSAPAVTGVYTNILPTPVPPYTNAVVPGQNRFFRLLAPLP